MDKRRVTRIPSIFDSDDDEDEISQDRDVDKEDVPDLASATSPANQISADEASGSKSVAENDDEDNVDRKMCKNDENEGTGKSVDEDNHSDKEDSIGEIHSSSLEEVVDDNDMTDDDEDDGDDDEGAGSVKKDGNDVAEGNGDVRDDDIIDNEVIANKDEDVNESKEDVNETKEDVKETKEDVHEDDVKDDDEDVDEDDEDIANEDKDVDEDDEDIANEDKDVDEDDEDITNEDEDVDEDVMNDVEEVINGGEYLGDNDANASEDVEDNVVNNGEETVNNKDIVDGEELNDGENSDDDMNEEEIDEMNEEDVDEMNDEEIDEMNEEEDDDMNEEDIDEMNEEDVGEMNEEDVGEMNEEDVGEMNEEDVGEMNEEDDDMNEEEMNEEDDEVNEEDFDELHEEDVDEMNSEDDMDDIEDVNKEDEKNIEEEDEKNIEEEAEAISDKSHDIGDDGDKVDELGTMEVSDIDNEDGSEDNDGMDVEESLEVADGDQDVEEEEEEEVEGVEDDIEGDDEIAHESEENEDSFEEEGNEGYVIDLNDSGNEADISKVEEKEEEVLNSSSSTENELKVDTEVNVGELVKGLERTGEAVEKDKENVSKESTTFKLPKSSKETEVEPCEEKEVQQAEEKEVHQNKEPVATSSKAKIPLVRVPVRVEDIFTDSEVEDEAAKEVQKDESVKEVDCVSESTASVDPEDQKEILSVSSRAGSIEPLASSPIVSPQKDKPAKIWVSKSIFERKIPKLKLEKKEPKLTVEKRRPKKVKGGHMFDQEKCLKALDEGWCREMVHRSTVDTTTPNRIRADIYYYSPSGKKLRSRVEIEQYLIKNNITSLTMANFSFAKQAIGGNEKQEIIRHATKTLGGTPRRKWQSTDTTDNDTPASTPPLSLKKRGRPKKFSPEPISKRVKTTKVLTPPQVAAKVSPRVVTQRVARDTSKVMTQQSTKDTSKETPQRVASEPSKVMTYKKAVPAMTSIPVPHAPLRSIPAIIRSPRWKTDYSVTKTVPSGQSASTMPVSSRPKYNDIRNHVVFTTRLCDTVGIQTRILTPMLSETARQQTFHCTGLCPQGQGLVPSLQCVKCLCLFHPKCTKMPTASLEIIKSGEAKFLCPNCYKENKVKAVFKKFKPPTPFEPLVQDPASSSASDDDDITVIEPVVSLASYVRVCISEPATLPTPPSSPMNQSADDPKERQSQSSAIMSSHVRHSTGMSSASSTCSQGLSANLPTDNITLPMGTNTSNLSSSNSLVGLTPGGQLLQIQAPGVGAPPRYILVRPPQNNSNLQNCTQVGPARAVYIPSAGPQIPIMLSNGGPTPQQQVYTASTPVRLPSSGSAPSPQLYSSSGYPFPQHTLIPSTGFQSSTTPEKQKTPPMSRPKTPVIQKKDFLQELSQSYRLLLRVFKYLTAKDLLITSRVCLMWRDLSYSSSLWNSLRLRNICVRDWNMLALFLERRNTKSIDLRKMVFRIKQSSPEPEVPSRIDSPEPDSSEQDSVASHPNDITPPSTSENSSQKASPEDSPQKPSLENSPQKSSSSSEGSLQKESSPEKSKDFEVNTTEATDVGDEKMNDVKEAIKDHPNEDSSVDVQQEPSNVEELTASEDKTLDKSIEEQVATVEDEDASSKQNTKDNTQDTVKMSSEDVCQDAKDSSDTEDEPMEIDEDEPNATTEDKSVNDKKEEENMEVVKDDKPVEELKEEEHKDKEEASKNDNSGEITHEQITKRRESSVGNLSSSEVDAASREDSASSKNKVIETWQHICEALGTVRCLRSVVLPPCTPEILQLLLSNCKNITSLTAADIGSTSDVNFDPAYLMEAPKLKEIRIGSTQGLSLTTNFNFIKLQELKVLVLRGFAGKSWPYLGTNLTSLHLGPCHSFTPLTWKNIGSMKNLRALWLEDGGSVKDILIFEAISQLTQLRRLCLFNFTIGPKLGLSLKKLTRLERIFVLQGSSDGVSMGLKNNNMLAVTEHLRFLDELVWAVSSQHVKLINGVDHMLIFSPKLKSYPSLSATENSSDQWPLKLIETVVKRHLPMTRVRIMKLDPAAAARMALSTL